MNWLDKHIKEQKHNRDIIDEIIESNAAEIQEMAERENWDRKKRK